MNLPVAKELVDEFVKDQDLAGVHLSLLDYAAGIYGQQVDRRRHNAQVDAMLKKKHGDCYEPPNEEEIDLNVIMNSIITDEQTLKAVTTKTEENRREENNSSPAPEPAPTQPSPPAPPSSPGKERNSLGPLLAAGILGGSLAAIPGIYTALNMPTGKDTNTDTQIIITPGDETQIEKDTD